MKLNDLYKLEKKDIDRSTDVAAKAFFDYPMNKYILGDNHNLDNIKIITRFIIKYCILYGQAYASSPEIEGIILYSAFSNYKFSLFRSLRAGAISLYKLGRDAGKRFNEYDQFCLKKHKESIKEPHQYIILLGVNPEFQGQGYGKKLLLSVLQAAEKKGEPCYLETHTYENVSIYRKFGFEIVSEEKIPGTDIVNWAMVKRTG